MLSMDTLVGVALLLLRLRPPLAPPQRVQEEEPHYCQMRVEVQTLHMVSIDTTG